MVGDSSSVIRWSIELKIGGKVDTVRPQGHTRRQALDNGLVIVVIVIIVIVLVIVSVSLVVLVPVTPATAATAIVSFLLSAGGLRPMVPALVSLHAAADSLRRDTGADLNIGLLDAHAADNGAAARTAKGRCQHPLAVGFGQFMDRDHADASRVVAAVTWAETNTPPGLNIRVRYVLVPCDERFDSETHPKVVILTTDFFHCGLGSLGIFAVIHFDKGVAFLSVDNASLDFAIAVEEVPKFLFGATVEPMVSGLDHWWHALGFWMNGIEATRDKDGHATYVTPPTNRVRLYTLIWPLGSVLSYSTHFS